MGSSHYAPGIRNELRLNHPAPDFEVASAGGTLRLSDYQGRWLLLFAHPADFTPVCTSEIVRLAKVYPRFRNLNTEVVALSLDSRFTHMAWLQFIEKEFEVKVPFPIIDDRGRKVADMYGMVHPEADKNTTVRSAFIIDDEGLLRLILHYPMWVGRSIDEILRVLQALQLADRENVATPEGWRPGEAVVKIPGQTTSIGSQRVSAGKGVRRWLGSTVDWISGINH